MGPFERKFEGFVFPEDVHSALAWDSFWEDVLDTAPTEPSGWIGLPLPPGRKSSPADRKRYYGQIRGLWSDTQYWGLFGLMRSLGVERVLFPGTGLCNLPHFFAHQGFQSLGIDTSRVASEFSRNHPPTLSWWVYWLHQSGLPETKKIRSLRNESSVIDVADRTRQPGGMVEFQTDDVFTAKLAQSSFDGIVVRFLLEHYDAYDRITIMEKLYRWLRPGGVLILQSECISYGDRDVPFRLNNELESVGFLHHLKDLSIWLSQAGVSANDLGRPEIETEYATRLEENKVRDLDRVASGHKLLVTPPV